MTIDLNLIGRILRELQAEIRTVRDENRLIRLELSDKATREEPNAALLRILSVLSDRIAQLETTIETRFDQTGRSIEERLTRIETLLAEKRP